MLLSCSFAPHQQVLFTLGLIPCMELEEISYLRTYAVPSAGYVCKHIVLCVFQVKVKELPFILRKVKSHNSNQNTICTYVTLLFLSYMFTQNILEKI